MEIPRTKGYTEIVKIAEAALNGDKEKARKYINKYLIKFPESDLVYPFTAILRGDLNPSGLHLCGQAEPIHDASALPICSVSCWVSTKDTANPMPNTENLEIMFESGIVMDYDANPWPVEMVTHWRKKPCS